MWVSDRYLYTYVVNVVVNRTIPRILPISHKNRRENRNSYLIRIYYVKSFPLRAVINEIFLCTHAHIIRAFKVKGNSPFLTCAHHFFWRAHAPLSTSVFSNTVRTFQQLFPPTKLLTRTTRTTTTTATMTTTKAHITTEKTKVNSNKIRNKNYNNDKDNNNKSKTYHHSHQERERKYRKEFSNRDFDKICYSFLIDTCIC
jgi:hypothetical protein